MSFLKNGFLSALLAFSFSASPCTEFRLQSKDQTTLITRTMEFGINMDSKLQTSNRGRKFVIYNDKDKSTFSWTAKYGYISFNAFNLDISADGMNEKGLSFSALYLPGFAEYQEPRKNSKNLPYYSIGDWILSNFSSIEEVKRELPKIRIISKPIKEFKDTVFPLHFSVYDQNGHGLVIEYVKGEINFHENKIGVFTNSPTYDWHLNNLNNFVNLRPTNPPSRKLNGVTIKAHGEGFGLWGLPGDLSPVSRFVKIATLLEFVDTPKNSVENLNLANHIINTVDIPRGIMREPNVKDPSTHQEGNGTTEWVTFKDLTNKILYFRTYKALQLRSIDMNKIDFSENNPRLQIDLTEEQTILDATEQLQKLGYR